MMTADLLIEATTVIDGTETPDYTADVPVTRTSDMVRKSVRGQVRVLTS
jgi:hypothetical protein